MTQDPSLQREVERWLATGLPLPTLLNALDGLIGSLSEALREEASLLESLQRELVYSLCWPSEVGERSLVSDAYASMGPTRFPIPADPEPLQVSIASQREKLDVLRALLARASLVREHLASRLSDL